MMELIKKLGIERDELQEKLTKLVKFLTDEEKVNEITELQFRLLHIQASAMETYLQTLNLRIDALTDESTSD